MRLRRVAGFVAVAATAAACSYTVPLPWLATTDGDDTDDGGSGDAQVLVDAGHADGSGSDSPFPSTGELGAFEPPSDAGVVVLDESISNFTTITIPEGVVVRPPAGNHGGVLELRATGDVEIWGIVDVSGGAGGSGTQVSGGGCSFGNGGGGTLGAPEPGLPGVNGEPCRPGGGGGGSTGDVAGDNGSGPCGAGGDRGGGAGAVRSTSGTTGGGAGGGGGFAGGGGGGTTDAGGGNGSSVTNLGVGGEGARADGTPARGGQPDAGSTYAGGDGKEAGGGGGAIGFAAVHDLAVTSTFQPGSSGGGGGGFVGRCGGGGGGGGGGGAILIASPTKIEIGSKAVIRANGGAGGSVEGVAGGAGGGGSGGVVYLSAPTILVKGELSALGGEGGTSNSGAGGKGGLGRIRLSVTSCVATGARFNPSLPNGKCEAAEAAGAAFIDFYPR